MNEKRKTMRRTVGLALLLLAPVFAAAVKTTGQKGANVSDTVVNEQWEYLVVGAASSINLSPPSNPRMRKEPTESFGREAFVLEQHLDKLGAKGWELVAVAGPSSDPSYYFKRRK